MEILFVLQMCHTLPALLRMDYWFLFRREQILKGLGKAVFLGQVCLDSLCREKRRSLCHTPEGRSQRRKPRVRVLLPTITADKDPVLQCLVWHSITHSPKVFFSNIV